ncbi:MAG: VWA domain-containing protein [Acidobacteriota bacterium]|nr:VWA domain-containing protein [Blastocatellia bacterium]MDW8412751.1 VWA domain-containing protein [Acidobacteriota bacterium]
MYYALITLLLVLPPSQSGIKSKESSAHLNAIIHTPGDVQLQIDRLLLIDGGLQQQIEYLRRDRSPARIALIVDDSQTLRTNTAKLKQIITELCKELYEGDEVMIVAAGEVPEVLEEFTGDLNKLIATTQLLRRKGLPRLYDAIAATVDELLKQPVKKRVIVLLSDGYDKDSKVKFDQLLDLLLDQDIIVYAFQVPDRTYGGIRPREAGPKPSEAIAKLTDYTGGIALSLEEISDIQVVASQIADEIRLNWFELSYTPQGVTTTSPRRILLTYGDEKVLIRTKKLQRPR